MAAKSAKQPPAASYDSSSEEEDQLVNQNGESASEYEDSDSNEETKPKPNDSTEEDGSESGDSDTNPESVSRNPTEKIHQKSVNKGNKKHRTETVPPAAASVKITSDGGDLKKHPIPRIWSLEDEKTLLNSMLQFRSEKGKEVDSSSLEYFCDFLKGKLSFTKRPKRRQISQKIEALKRKFSRKRLTKKHDVEMKEIATQLWKLDANSKSSKRKLSFLGEEIEKLGNPRWVEKLKSGYNEGKAEALEQKIKKQKILEMKEEWKSVDLIREAFKLIVDGLEK